MASRGDVRLNGWCPNLKSTSYVDVIEERLYVSRGL